MLSKKEESYFYRYCFNQLADIYSHISADIFVDFYFIKINHHRDSICSDEISIEGDGFGKDFGTEDRLRRKVYEYKAGVNKKGSFNVGMYILYYCDVIEKFVSEREGDNGFKWFISGNGLQYLKESYIFFVKLDKNIYKELQASSSEEGCDLQPTLIDKFNNEVRKELERVFRTDHTRTLVADLDWKMRSYQQLINKAGDSLLTDIQRDFNYSTRSFLFDNINEVAVRAYEGSQANGEIVISKPEAHGIEKLIEFKEPVEFEHTASVRKLLELTGEDTQLLSDATYIYGVGRFDTKNSTANSERIYVISFKQFFYWELYHRKKPIMGVKHGRVSFPQKKIDSCQIELDLKRIFHGIDDKDLSSLGLIIREMVQQRHGTLLVITSSAEEEAERLQKQSIPIQKVPLDQTLVQAISSIDGAVLIDPNANCHAIGVILDGVAQRGKGDSSRGARYNSAFRYYEHQSLDKEKQLYIVIVSEDGMIDTVPPITNRGC
ncbi:diadenylate cyclase [Desulfovibrio sp. UCD-KL4C]|uniref:diadenylate cyclase n=1 Tax=Desulfovibrio sp. UCD-KL4C TaxID=2578120 RepID=UPI0025BA61E8|nr:diadenylate cyclase [Desulfovibrio sp. UCD-KL4C]